VPRPVGAIIASSTEAVGRGALFRTLSDGRVLVNDLGAHRIVLFDPSLQHAVVVADTTAATGKAYGSGLSGLIKFAGDSSLVVDRLASAFVVIDPGGKIARIIKTPRGFYDVPGAQAAFYRAGHLLYRAPPPAFLMLLDPDFVGDTIMRGPDSTQILRMDMATGRLDTAATLEAPRIRQAVTRRGGGRGGTGRPLINPVQTGDDWTLMDDGAIAIVRARDFRVDWAGTDGRMTAGPALPGEWMHLSAAMKAAMTGSLPLRFVEPSDLPDSLPPFMKDLSRATADGQLWIRLAPTAASAGASEYDVVDRSGRLVDRVRLPANATVVGFTSGTVYFTLPQAGGLQLSKASIR
jgi:hypothetical protein